MGRVLVDPINGRARLQDLTIIIKAVLFTFHGGVMEACGPQRRRSDVAILFSYVSQRKLGRDPNPNAMICWPIGWNNLFVMSYFNAAGI